MCAGAASSAGVHGSISAPIGALHPDRWRNNPIADEGQVASSSSRDESFTNQVLSLPSSMQPQ